MEITRALAAHCDRVVAAEVHRLGQRRPALPEQALGVVDTALRELADALVLAPVRRHPEHERRAGVLFAVIEAPDRTVRG